MKLPQHFCAELVRHRLHEWLREQLVAALIELRHLGDRLEGLLVVALEAVHPRHDVFEAMLAKLDFVFRRPALAGLSVIAMP